MLVPKTKFSAVFTVQVNVRVFTEKKRKDDLPLNRLVFSEPKATTKGCCGIDNPMSSDPNHRIPPEVSRGMIGWGSEGSTERKLV